MSLILTHVRSLFIIFVPDRRFLTADDAAEMQAGVVLKSFAVLYSLQATEEDGSSDEEMDDDAMIELDKSLAALFSEQKKKNQAKKDEKSKLQKEKTLVRDFKIKVPHPHPVC